MEEASKRGKRRAVHRGVELICSTRFEEEARATGHKLVAGVDEAGRGALCGPVVAAAVVLGELDLKHPGYDLARNMGYGSEEHRIALRRLGPSPIHRRSFGGTTQAWLFR